MLDIFHGFKNIIKITRLHTDGSVFRLHYQVTVVILIAFSIVVTTRQYVGNPIECNHSQDVSEAVINTYCWISSTHTVLSAYNPIDIGFDNTYPYPGVGHSKFEHERKYHKYYQWVCFMLFFQAVLFYIPRWLWKNWEGGKIQALMMDLHIGISTEAEKRAKKKLLLDYLWCNLRNHNWWACRYFFCELLCFVNVVGQIFLMDVFLDGEFLTYGTQVLEFMETDQGERVDPMVYVFPRVTKCHFHKIGRSGTVERHDAICILPLNVVNEKIYIFLWFWFIILAALTGLVLLYRLLIICVPRVRVLLLQVRFGLIPKDHLEKLVAKSQIGDWLLFYMLGQNVDMLIFKDVIGELTGCVDKNGLEPAVWPFGYGHSLYVDYRATC